MRISSARNHALVVQRIAVLVLVVAIAGYFIHRYHEQFAGILRIRAWQALVLVALTVLSGSLQGLVTMLAANHLGARISLREALAIAWATSYANFLPMKAGLALQGLYLNKRHALPYARFLALTAGAYVIQFLLVGLTGVALSLGPYFRGRCHAAVPLGFASLAIGSLVPIALGRAMGPTRVAGGGVLARIMQGWALLASAPLLLLKLSSVIAGTLLLLATRLWLAYGALHYATPWRAALVVAMASTLVQITSIVPGGLGLREAAIGGLGTAFGVAFGPGVVAASLDRASSMLPIFLIGPFALHVILRGSFPASAASGGHEAEPPGGG